MKTKFKDHDCQNIVKHAVYQWPLNFINFCDRYSKENEFLNLIFFPFGCALNASAGRDSPVSRIRFFIKNMNKQKLNRGPNFRSNHAPVKYIYM